ncbi:GSCOCG00009393001-RA-CDS [Cotesia congregata]|nr:GSCOCG00009393001-RA-CDS [Cotesia congregata]
MTFSRCYFLSSTVYQLYIYVRSVTGTMPPGIVSTVTLFPEDEFNCSTRLHILTSSHIFTHSTDFSLTCIHVLICTYIEHISTIFLSVFLLLRVLSALPCTTPYGIQPYQLNSFDCVRLCSAVVYVSITFVESATDTTKKHQGLNMLLSCDVKK